MASTPKVGSAIPTGVTSAASRVMTGGGVAPYHPAEAVWSGAPITFDARSRAGLGDQPEDQGGQYTPSGSRRQPGQPQFTPLVGRMAAAFPAVPAGGEAVTTPLFLTDLLHGVGIYEFNMKLFSGAYASQGSVINRYS